MKKIKTTFIITLAHLLICTSLMAQAPQGFEYQAVVRNASGNILVSQSVGLQITLKQGSASGINVYQETFTATTNLYGLVNLQIGSGTTGDDFTTIDWANGPYFVEVSLDVTGGTSYSVMGTSQLLSVPYALHAKTVEIDNVDDADNDPSNEIELPSSANVGDVLTWNGTNWVASPKSGGKTYLILSGDITDSEAVIKIAEEVGTNTQFVMIQNTTNLTTVDLSGITELVDLTITDNINLSTVILSSLVDIYSYVNITNNTNLSSLSVNSLTQIGKSMVFTDNPAISALNLPNLATSTYGLQVERCNNLASLNVPVLEKVSYLAINSTAISSLIFTNITTCGSLLITNNLALSSIDISNITTCDLLLISNNLVLSSIDISNLSSVEEQIGVSNNPLITTLNFSSLNSVGAGSPSPLLISYNSSLTTLNFPLLNAEVMGCEFQNNSLTSISHPNLKPTSQYNISGNNLSSSAINSLLNYFVNISPSLNSGLFQLNNQNPPAPPTGQGITDKNTLISNGITLFTD